MPTSADRLAAFRSERRTRVLAAQGRPRLVLHSGGPSAPVEPVLSADEQFERVARIANLAHRMRPSQLALLEEYARGLLGAGK